MEPPRPKSALAFVLKALIPYSRQNLVLSFKPNQFFKELEQISSYKKHTLELAAHRAIQQGLIQKDRNRNLKLTELGHRAAIPYVAKRLAGDAQLMVIFDIAESNLMDRQRLRRLLKKWQFLQVQKSVWMTNYDFVQPLREAIEQLGLEDSVKLYECAAV